jgi:prolipoprotein diacylglyceryl transferase
MLAFLSFIPSPATGDDPWTRRFRLYGLMIAAGVIACLEMARHRWGRRGGDPEDMSSVALWAVPAGLIGARLYHVITDNQLYRGRWFDNPFAPGSQSPLDILNGGLGIPGGLLLGGVLGAWAARRRGMRLGPGLDAVAPGVPLAQAIGRLGNYFNQELFGRPTEVPWALEVPPGYRPENYPNAATFHPTFAYEALWNLGLMGVLLWIDKHWRLRPGRLFLLYVAGYFTGRLWVEALRSDEANTILGLRVNTWTSLLVIVTVVAIFLVGGFRSRPGDVHEPYHDGHRFDAETGTIIPAPGTGAPLAEGEAGDAAFTDDDAEDGDDDFGNDDFGEDGDDGDEERDGDGVAADAPGTGQRVTGGEDAKPDAEP